MLYPIEYKKQSGSYVDESKNERLASSQGLEESIDCSTAEPGPQLPATGDTDQYLTKIWELCILSHIIVSLLQILSKFI